MIEPAAESDSDALPTHRLTVRVKLIPPQSPPPARRLSPGAWVAIVAAAAILLGWLGVSVFRSDPTSAPSAAPAPQRAQPAEAPLPQSASAPVEPQVAAPPAEAPTSAIAEIIPDVPKNALDTIRGTIKVSVRVTIDKQGKVITAAVDEPGPSRYFRRLAVDAAKKWTFSSSSVEERRTMLVSFNFTRAGVTGEASPAP